MPGSAVLVATARLMTTDDLPRVLAAEQLCFPQENWSEQTFRDELRYGPDARSYIVAERSGIQVGYAGMKYGPHEARIVKLAVAPEHRHRGVGRLLLFILLRDASARGHTEVHLEVRSDNRQALRLYESAHFERVAVRRGYYDQGKVDAIAMRRQLPFLD